LNPAAAPLASPAEAIRVCAVDDVPVGEGRAATVEGRRIAVFNTGLGWFALDDACPHRGGPLSDGILADSCVSCPLHERRFDLRTGEGLDGDGPATAHRVVVDDGDVLVELS
jgi:nitrite reductase (NADH) small subunit